MKKIISILAVFLGIGFVICFALGMFLPVPAEVPAKGMFAYKFCNCIEYFLIFLPAMLITGFVVSCSVHFGRNSEGSTMPFSKAMADRYKIVMIIAIAATFILTLSNETFGVLVKQRKNAIINKPKIIMEYIKVGNNLYKEGLYERSTRYAQAALKMDPNSSQARDLLNKNDMEINREYTNNLKFDLSNKQPLVEKDNSLIINEEKIEDAYKCYLQAQEAYDNKQWFNAHYYAELGLKLTSAKDPNQENLRTLSAKAWNNITEDHKNAKTDSQSLYEQKYRGYLALTEKDDLEAYYIFRNLHENYADMSRDPDVNFYLEIAQNRIEQKYFFVDETFELQSFENANDVYFSYRHIDGSCDLVYFKGMTSVKSTGHSIQYLRDFSIVTINRKGEWVKTMNVPYAKLMPVSVKSLTPATKAMMEIDEKTEYVPYILLKSVGRNSPQISYGPTYTYANGEVATIPEYMIFPLNYSDFLMLEETPEEPQSISLLSLAKLISKCEDFGYSSEQFGHVLLNRFLYPFFILVIFLFLAGFAWNNRLGATQYFRFTWVFCFPLLIIASVFVYQMLLFLYKLLNYVLLGVMNTRAALGTGVGFYVLLMIIGSVLFLAKDTRS